MQEVVGQRTIGSAVSDDGMLAVVVNQCDGEPTRRFYVYVVASSPGQLAFLGLMAIFGMVADQDVRTGDLMIVGPPGLMSGWVTSVPDLCRQNKAIVKGKASDLRAMYRRKGETVIPIQNRLSVSPTSPMRLLAVGERAVRQCALPPS